MFKMKYTQNDTVIKTLPLNNTGRNIPLPAFNVKGNGDINSRALTIGNMFERVRSGNDSCGNCGGFKSAF